MQKKHWFCAYVWNILNKNRSMKLSFLLFALVLFNSHANSYGQNKKISLDVSDESIESVLEKIEASSKFNFFYKTGEVDVKRKVSLKVVDTPIYNILDLLFDGNNISYTVLKKQIVLKAAVTETSQLGRKANLANMPPIQSEISGTIADQNGTPLPGANILEKGTTNGAQADFDGNFSISVADENAILVISYIGFASKEVSTNGATDLTIVLEESAAGLDEVVVVGYGTQKRSDVTGAVASVKGVTIAKQATVNASQALQGQVPGVTVVNSSGVPGAGTSILIRGQGSYGGIDPLYVVDGAITDGIDFLNPLDIQSIEILKDASASAIYGSRAANGVVLVTTKRGKSGKSQLSFSSNFGIQTLAGKLDFATSQEWRDKEVWKFQNEGLDIPVNLQEANFDPAISTDWQDVLYSSAEQQSYNIGFSGGGEDSNFYFSLGYIDQEGILVDSGYDRINFRANSDYRLGRFKFGESISINRTSFAGSSPSSFQPFPPPIFAPTDPDGSFNVIPDGWGADPAPALPAGNPLANIKLNEPDNSEVFISGNVFGQVQIIDGLTFKTSASIAWEVVSLKNYQPEWVVDYLTNPVADLSQLKSEDYTFLWENTLDYNKSFGNHTFNAVVGWTRQSSQFNAIVLNSEGFPTGISEPDAAQTILPSSGGNRINESLESYFGRINYSYKNKYQATATVRQDASSLLIKELRTGTFPSFSLGWVVSEESFFPENDIVTRLKFRGGYGELGRLNAISPYQVQNTLTFGGSNIDYILGRGQTFANGSTLSSFANPNILWERAQSTNFAMEASLFKNKVSLTAEYFVKNTRDLQFDSPIPATVGTNESSILVNAGDIQNKGVEFTLGYNESIGDFNINIIGNIFALSNEVLEFNNPDDAFVGGTYGFAGQDATRAEVGRELSNFWLIKTDGFFNSQAEIDAYSQNGVLIQPNAQPGDLRFIDFNNDGTINDDDRQFIDGSIPDFEYGLNLSASYKNIDFSMIIQGVVGQKIFNGVGRALNFTLQDPTVDHWRPDNLDAEFFRPSVSDPNANRGSNDFFLEDAGYLRLRNVQLGYSLPENTISSIGMKSLRISLTGQNLFTATEFTGYNPENISFGLDRGVNTEVFPLAKTVLLGLTANF